MQRQLRLAVLGFGRVSQSVTLDSVQYRRVVSAAKPERRFYHQCALATAFIAPASQPVNDTVKHTPRYRALGIGQGSGSSTTHIRLSYSPSLCVLSYAPMCAGYTRPWPLSGVGSLSGNLQTD